MVWLVVGPALFAATFAGGQSWDNGGDMIGTVIAAAVSNFTVTFLVIGLLAAAVAIARAERPWHRAVVVDRLLAYYALFAIGVTYFVNFVFHSFFGRMTAAFIGWADSPFQYELGWASLGFSVGGFLAAFGSFDRRLIAVIGPGLFCLGAAIGHVQQMLTAGNYAPGNAGVIFYTDILIPLFGFALLWLQWRDRRAARSDPSRFN